MEYNKLESCNRIYMKHAMEEARELITALNKFLSDPGDTNTARIEFSYRGFIRAKNIADAMGAHRD